MRNEFDYAHERPSRLSRAVVLLSTLGVALIAAWVFTPILLANYTAHTATVSAAAKPVREPVATASSAIVVPSAVAASAAPPAAASSGVLTTTALAATSDDAASAAPPAPVNVSARSLIPWPSDSPPMAPPAASAAPADTGSVRTAAVNATADPVDPVDPANIVPLPRRRPSRAIAAYLAIPLPRPRPEIVSENTPPSRPTTFDLQVERMR